MTTLARVLHALTAGVALVAIVAGLPAALLTWGTSPVRGGLDGESLREVAYELGSDRVLVGALTIAAWIVWALFLRALVLELLAVRRATPSTGTGPLRNVARGLVVWLTMTAGTLGSMMPGAGASNATPALASVLATTPVTAPADQPLVADTTATAPESNPAVPVGRRVVVETPSDAWNLAEQHLGDGMRWRDLWTHNRHTVQPDGQRWTDAEATIPAGWELVIPDDMPAPTPPAPAPAPPSSSRPIGEVEVAPGDHFWQLAEAQLTQAWGRPATTTEISTYWHQLVEANRDRLAPPGHPDVIYPGQTFVTPEAGHDPLVSAEAIEVTPEANAEPTTPTNPATDDADDADADDAHAPTGPSGTADDADAAGAPATTDTPATDETRSAQPTAPQRVGDPTAGTVTEAEEPSDDPTPATPPSTVAPLPGTGEEEGAAQSTAPDAGAVPAAPEADDSATTTSTSTDVDQPAATDTTELPLSAESAVSSHQQSEQDGSHVESDQSRVPAAPLLGVAGTVVAVALLRAWRTRQARRAAQLPLDVIPPPLPAGSRPVVREILNRSDDEAVDRLDAAMAHLAAGLRPRGGQPCVQPKLVQVTGDRIEVLLDRAEPATPAGWRPQASGMIWTLDADIELPEPDPDAVPPIPALVTIGTGDSDILIDLEAYGIVSLTGDPDACWALARSMLLEISARAEGIIGIEVVGDNLQDTVADLDGVSVADSWDTVDTHTIASSANMLDAGRWPHSFAARASGQVWYGWEPAVWITAHHDHPHYQATIEAVAARPGSGSAIVVAGDDPGHGLRIDLAADGTFEIPDLGLTGTAQQIQRETVDQVVDLLEDADNMVVAQTFDFPATTTGLVDDESAVVASAIVDDTYEDPAFDVIVRVCGAIQVQGGKEPLNARETAVAAYIALNGERDLSQIRDAVWDGADVSVKRVRNVISSLRLKVGDAIYYPEPGRLRAGDNLVTDLELIRRRLAYAQHQVDPEARAATLRGALGWVTAKVCTFSTTASGNWGWIDIDNWTANAESLVGAVASELATLYLDLDDSDGAGWAAQHGITATGPREQLTLLLVQAYELAGDEPAAAAALRSYQRHIDDLGLDAMSEPLAEALARHLPGRRDRAAS